MVPAGELQVLVADEQPVYCRGLAAVVAGEPDMRILGACGDPLALRRVMEHERPDAVVVGLSGAGSEDHPWLEALPESDRGRNVLALTDSSDGGRLGVCVRAGIRSLASRCIGDADLVAAIRLVAAERMFMSAGAVEAMMREMSRLTTPSGGPLTARELQILRMLADGKKAPAIAAELVVEPTTIKTHLQHMFEKLEVSNQAAAVAKDLRRGLLD